jgi:hypothetical protein
MSEFHTPGVYINDAQILEAEAVGAQALDMVEARFGSGYPEYRHATESGGLAYHNRHHSEAVQQGTERMGEALGLTRSELAIGRVAAAAHDIVQLKPRGVMEQESAEWLAERLDRRGFTGRAIAIGSLAILGTEPLFENNRLVGQVASIQEYPSKSAELVSKSVACADLGELHSPLGPLLGHDLFKEICGTAPDEEPPMDKLLGFQQGQLWLAENYQYPHVKGEAAFGGLRGKVVEYSAKVLGQLERGEITWRQLIEQDKAFARANA